MEPVTSETIRAFLQRLSERYTQGGQFYLLGGSALCLLGSPRETRDIDYVADIAPEGQAQFQAAIAMNWGVNCGLEADLEDALFMLRERLIQFDELQAHFNAIWPQAAQADIAPACTLMKSDGVGNKRHAARDLDGISVTPCRAAVAAGYVGQTNQQPAEIGGRDGKLAGQD